LVAALDQKHAEKVVERAFEGSQDQLCLLLQPKKGNVSPQPVFKSWRADIAPFTPLD
jgi:hypothetical protein